MKEAGCSGGCGFGFRPGRRLAFTARGSAPSRRFQRFQGGFGVGFGPSRGPADMTGGSASSGHLLRFKGGRGVMRRRLGFNERQRSR